MKTYYYSVLKGVIVGLHERAVRETGYMSLDFLVAGKLFEEDLLNEETVEAIRCRLAAKVVDLYGEVEGEKLSEVAREYHIVKLMETFLKVTKAPDPHSLDSEVVRQFLKDIDSNMADDDKMVLGALSRVASEPIKQKPEPKKGRIDR